MNQEQALQILKLTGCPSREEIEKAYRSQVFELHPDRNQGVSPAVMKMLEDRVAQLSQARETLLNATSSERQSDEGPSRAAVLLEHVELDLNRRDFAAAFQRLDEFEAEFGRSPVTSVLRLTALTLTERWTEAIVLAESLMVEDPECTQNADFLNRAAQVASAAKRHDRALELINSAHAALGRRVAEFIATEAMILIGAGRSHEADAVISELARIDPTNDLVAARKKVMRIGDTFVDKSDARNSACVACMILELVFDCI